MRLFCVNKEIRFPSTPEINQHFVTPKPLALIEGDGYTPVENWISMLHGYMKTTGVFGLLIELAVDWMIAKVVCAGSLWNFWVLLIIRKCSSHLSTEQHHLQRICVMIVSSGKTLELSYYQCHCKVKDRAQALSICLFCFFFLSTFVLVCFRLHIPNTRCNFSRFPEGWQMHEQHSVCKCICSLSLCECTHLIGKYSVE